MADLYLTMANSDKRQYRVISIKSHCPNHEIKKAAACSMYTGFRWCHVKQLRWYQIKDQRVVLSKQSKTGIPFKVPLDPVIKILYARLVCSGHTFLLLLEEKNQATAGLQK